nr:PREDICTED: synapse-associated protein of 47 kDa isoform X2 [Bemisia tabaci]
MFSGITNQMSNWVGSVAKKSDSEVKEDEKPTSPTAVAAAENIENVEAANPEEAKKETSPTKVNSKLEMLGNVKSQMSSWLGGGIQLPSLRKTETEAAAEEGGAEAKQSAEAATDEKAIRESMEKDDDNSSATGGADSDAHLSDLEGEEDKDGAFGGGVVGAKAVQGAKSIGSFLFSAVNKAGKTVSEASAKIKKTVEENSILGEFNKEQESFIKEKEGKGSDGAAVPPWVGCPNEENLKQECLSLSTDRRNFVRPPPAGVDFEFDFESFYPVAQAILAVDPELEKMRFELVPKVINEENFWRNYFYRVSLICQANELSSMAQEGQQNAANASQDADEPNEEEWEKELEAELQEYEVVSEQQKQNTAIPSKWESQIEDMLESESRDLK